MTHYHVIDKTTKEGLSGFEVLIIELLRKKGVVSMEKSGNIVIHYDKDTNPVGVEKRLIYT